MPIPRFSIRRIIHAAMPILAALSILSACAPASAEEFLPTSTPTLTQPPTATIDWFPATATPTRAPTNTIQPTPDQRPALGEVSLTDDFSDPTTWQTFDNNQGTAAYGKGDLTIAVSQPRGYLASMDKQALLTDFYLEMTLSPSLCRGDDAYGLLFRAATSLDAYRLLFNCSGLVRLERMVGGKPVPLHDWEASGQVPPGSPLEIRVGVWAVKNEMRVFVNDFYQFAVRDPVHRTGGIAVFARSGGTNALTVSFSNLMVRSIVADQVPTFAPATPIPTQTPRK
jgi:hypothetical protein